MDVTIVMPFGAMGASDDDDMLDTILRQIAMKYGDEEHNWVSKYGTDIENDIFMMRPYCWCEKEDCGWCGEQNLPNFWYKPTDFKVWWYKYIGRDPETNRQIDESELKKILEDCIK